MTDIDVSVSDDAIVPLLPDDPADDLLLPDDMIAATVLTADGAVRENMLLYVREQRRNVLPHCVSGLKRAHERILWTVASGNGEYVGAAIVCGYVQTLHNHGIDTIYDTAARLAMPWRWAPPILELGGNKGGYDGKKMAAYRYTRLRLSAFGRKLFFLDIDKNALPKERSIGLHDREPIHLIPAVPVALFGENLAIATGHASLTAPIGLGKTCDLVTRYTDHLKKNGPLKPFKASRYPELLLPEFPIANTITNVPYLLAEYSKGNFNATIEMDGDVELQPGVIAIRALPYGKNFGSIRARIDHDRDSRNKTKKHPWSEDMVAGIQDVKYLTNEATRGNTVIYLKRGVDVFEFWENLARYIGFSGTLVPNPNFTDNEGYVLSMDPELYLDMWYQKRYDLIMSTKRNTLSRLMSTLRELEAELTIRDHVDEVVGILKSNTLDDSITKISQRFDLTINQARHLTRASLASISSTEISILVDKIKRQEERIQEHLLSFQKVPDEIAATARGIKREYSQETPTIYPTYIGCVNVIGPSRGCIQFSTIEEMNTILDNFPKTPVEVYTYETRKGLARFVNMRWDTSYIPKYGIGDVVDASYAAHGYTVSFDPVESTACAVKGMVPAPRSEGYRYVPENVITLTRDGKVGRGKVKDLFAPRKIVGRGKITDVIHVHANPGTTTYLVTMVKDDPNVITIHAIRSETNSVVLPIVGEIDIRYSLTGTDWCFTPREEFLNRNPVRAVHILDAEKALNGKNSVKVDIGRGSRRNPNVRTVV